MKPGVCGARKPCPAGQRVMSRLHRRRQCVAAFRIIFIYGCEGPGILLRAVSKDCAREAGHLAEQQGRGAVSLAMCASRVTPSTRLEKRRALVCTGTSARVMTGLHEIVMYKVDTTIPVRFYFIMRKCQALFADNKASECMVMWTAASAPPVDKVILRQSRSRFAPVHVHGAERREARTICSTR